MFAWFQNLNIGTRILVCVLIPVAGLLFFAGTTMISKYEAAHELRKVGKVTNLAPTVSALVHELQKERGRSAGFIGSKGESFANALPTQRRDTDTKVKKLKAAFADFDVAAFDPALATAAEDAFANPGARVDPSNSNDSNIVLVSRGLITPDSAWICAGCTVDHNRQLELGKKRWREWLKERGWLRR